MSEESSAFRDDPALLKSTQKPRVLNRRLAAAYVGVTAGRFEQLIREKIIPEAIVIDRNRLWDICALDQVINTIRQMTDASNRSEVSARLPRSLDPRQIEERPGHPLPDQAWLQKRSDFVDRVRRSLLSQYEFNLLREFKAQHCNEISMFGFYSSFEALMARGYVIEVSRSPPLSRPLVIYRLTELGSQIVASI